MIEEKERVHDDEEEEEEEKNALKSFQLHPAPLDVSWNVMIVRDNTSTAFLLAAAADQLLQQCRNIQTK